MTGNRTGQAAAQTGPAAGAAAEYLAGLCLGLVLAPAQLLGSIHPFAAAMLATAVPGGRSAAIFLGAMAGSLFCGSYLTALKYMAILVLTISAVYAFRGTRMARTDWFPSAVSGGMTFIVGLVYAANAGWTFAATALLVIETCVCAACAWFFLTALAPWDDSGLDRQGEIRHAVAVLVLICCCLVTLTRLNLFSVVSVGRAAAVLVVIIAAYAGGMSRGCVCGLAIGMAMDAARGGTPYFAMIYAFSGLAAGLTGKRGRLPAIFAYALANTAAVVLTLPTSGEFYAMYETLLGTMAFLLIPGKSLRRFARLFPSRAGGYGRILAGEYLCRQVRAASQAFREAGSLLRSCCTAPVETDETEAFLHAASSACRGCEQAAVCWEKELEVTRAAISDAAPLLMRRGYLRQNDFSQRFLSRCADPEGFINAVNSEARALLYRRQYKARLRSGMWAACSQYTETAQILSGVAGELAESSADCTALEHKLHHWLRSRDEHVTGALFRDRRGCLHGELHGPGLGALRRAEDLQERLSTLLGTEVDVQTENGKLLISQQPPFAACVGVAGSQMAGQEVSGDNASFFKTDSGEMFVLLSDGMGSGPEAARSSKAVLQVLGSFLRCGVSPDSSLRLLGDLMLMKNEDDTSFATVDLLRVNLFTGMAELYKLGSAPTYLYRAGTVRRYRSRSMAAGLESSAEGSADVCRIRLDDGSFLVLCSDGLVIAQEDNWLKAALESAAELPATDMARLLVGEAETLYGRSDDMTAIVLRLERRNAQQSAARE